MSDIPAINYKDVKDTIELLDATYVFKSKLHYAFQKNISKIIEKIIDDKYSEQLIDYPKNQVRYKYLACHCSVSLYQGLSLIYPEIEKEKTERLKFKLSVILIESGITISPNFKDLIIRNFKSGWWYRSSIFKKNGTPKKGYLIIKKDYVLDENFSLCHSQELDVNLAEFDSTF